MPEIYYFLLFLVIMMFFCGGMMNYLQNGRFEIGLPRRKHRPEYFVFTHVDSNGNLQYTVCDLAKSENVYYQTSSLTFEAWKQIGLLRGYRRMETGTSSQTKTQSNPNPKPKQTPPETWWDILGLSPNATKDDINRAHRNLAMKHHPDKGGNPNTMTKINVARDIGLSMAS